MLSHPDQLRPRMARVHGMAHATTSEVDGHVRKVLSDAAK